MSKNINMKMRNPLLKAYIWSVALYRSVTRTIVEREEKKTLRV